MQSYPFLERLDWFFTSASWTLSYHNALVFDLAMKSFDHIPCVIHIQNSMPKSNIFRFKNSWMEHDHFFHSVKLFGSRE